MEPSYVGCNHRIDAMSVAWLFAQDHVFFNPDEITWDGFHHGISGAQINDANMDEIPAFVENADMYFSGFSELLLELEKDEDLRVPRSSIHPALHEAIREGDLTGLTLFNLMACAHSYKFLTDEDAVIRGEMLRMCASNLGGRFNDSAAAADEYVVVVDSRLTRGIPRFYELIARMVSDMRNYNEIDAPFFIVFANCHNVDADQYLGHFDGMVQGAVSEPFHIEMNMGKRQACYSGNLSEENAEIVEPIQVFGSTQNEGALLTEASGVGSSVLSFEDLKRGASLELGSYPYGKEGEKIPIKWTVLSSEPGRALLITKEIIDYRAFNDGFAKVGWKDSSLRRWMNGEFFDTAFAPEEKSWILEHGVMSGVNDRVFALSQDEASRLFDDGRERSAAATPYASAHGTSGRWWTRTSAAESGYIVNVSRIGLMRAAGDRVSLRNCGVRPAMYIAVGRVASSEADAIAAEDDDWAWADIVDDSSMASFVGAGGEGDPLTDLLQVSNELGFENDWAWTDDEKPSNLSASFGNQGFEDGQVIAALLRLLVLSNELSGGKTRFPQELLDELGRAESGDETIDLQDLAERMNALMPKAKAADLSDATFGGSNVAEGRRFSVVVPDGWTILRNYHEMVLFADQVRPFVVVQGPATNDDDLNSRDRIIYSSLSGDIEVDEIKLACGTYDMNWALHWCSAYVRSDEGPAALKPTVVWDTEVEAVNTKCFITQHEINPGPGGIEFDVYPYANDHTDSLRFVFGADENADIEAIKNLVLSVARTVKLDEPVMPECERVLSKAMAASITGASFTKMSANFMRPFVGLRQMVFDAAQHRYAVSATNFDESDCILAGAYGIATLCNRAIPVLDRLLDAYDYQIDFGTEAGELLVMVDALESFNENAFPRESIFGEDDAALVRCKGVFDSSAELKAVRRRLESAVLNPGKKTHAIQVESYSAEGGSCESAVPMPKGLNVALGDVVELGTYPTGSNGAREVLKWRVIDIKGNHALILCESLIDCKKYNEGNGPTNWADSSIRKWLGDEFAARAFSTEDKKRVAGARISNEANDEYGTPGCGDTKDRVFLLSVDEVERLLPNVDDRCAEPTDYAEARGANRFWWLRSPGLRDTHAAYVGSDGAVNKGGSKGSLVSRSIRPALYLKAEGQGNYAQLP